VARLLGFRRGRSDDLRSAPHRHGGAGAGRDTFADFLGRGVPRLYESYVCVGGGQGRWTLCMCGS
jgi:hypothetical protein